MTKHTFRSGLLVVILAGGATAACAKHAHPPTTAERAKVARGEMRDRETLTATVESLDKANQTVILRDEQGNRLAIDVDERAIERLQPNDTLKLVYQETLAFALEEPTEQPTVARTQVEESAERDGDDAVQVGRRVSTTVQIVSVAPRGTAVEFRVPEGGVRTVAIDHAENQREVENLRPGDSVRVTYTEKLALVVDEPPR